MSVSDKLTQEKFQEILINTYARGVETENIKVNELIKEIVQQIMALEK